MQSDLMKVAVGNQTPPKEKVLTCSSPLRAISDAEGEKAKSMLQVIVEDW